MSKTTLMIVGIILILMGIGGLMPSMTLGTEPMWHAVAKILVGIISVWVSAADKR